MQSEFKGTQLKLKASFKMSTDRHLKLRSTVSRLNGPYKVKLEVYVT